VRLLVVEDEARIVEILRFALKRVGFVVDAVGHTAAAFLSCSGLRNCPT
jgi:DNA-binding response OmpR family regulator